MKYTTNNFGLTEKEIIEIFEKLGLNSEHEREKFLFNVESEVQKENINLTIMTSDNTPFSVEGE